MERTRKRVICVLGILCIILGSCHETSVPESNSASVAASIMQNPGRADSILNEKKLLIRVDPGVCVFVLPSSIQLDRMQKQSASEDEFNSMMEEGGFYVSKAKEYLEMIHTASVDVTSDDSLDFVSEDGKHYSIRISGMSWDLILYNGKDAPFRSDITMPEEECKKLYGRK